MLSEQTEKISPESQDVPAVSQGPEVMKKSSQAPRQDAHARADMYAFFAAVYLRPPTPSLMRYLLAENFLEELTSLFGEEIVADLRKIAADTYPDSDFAAVDQEYMSLFAVPTGRYVTPFEDVYRGIGSEGMLQRGPLLGERAIAARRKYRAAGADMDRECRELPTHIGVELAYMSFLCERQAAEMDDDEQKIAADGDRYRELQIRFLREHLNNWFPQLNQTIQANAKSSFYRGMARITAVFLDHDTARLLAF